MNKIPKLQSSLFHPLSSIIIVALAFLLLGSFAAFAQDTNIATGGSPVAPTDAPAQITSGLESTITQFAQTHPWVIALLSFLGALRLFIKPIMTGLHYWAAQTETEADDDFLNEVEHSWLYTAFLFSLDWLASIKVAPKPNNSSNALRALLFILLPSAFILGGCAALDPAGVYHGDQILHKSELVTTTSYEVIHTYVSWEKENRVALAKYPEIKQSADVMRRNARQWFTTANALHDAYAANPTPENGAALNTALAVLQTALNEAVKYMTQAAAGAPTASGAATTVSASP